MRIVAHSSDQLRVAPQFQPAFRELGIDAQAIFTHELIKPWRTLSDRENCTLDATLSDGTSVRWHVKRFAPARGRNSAEAEVAGHGALVDAGIPTAELVGWGALRDRRSFVVFNDLRGFSAADKLVEQGLPFAEILEPTADLTASLHNANLHHRDLYLCHFFARVSDERAVEVRLIDAARVRPLPRLTRSRWIIKDLAQFWYSTLPLPVTDEQRQRLLARYASRRHLTSVDSLRRAIERKVQWIGRHDAQLRRRQPSRNISIPK
jgi:hypothetical protein